MSTNDSIEISASSVDEAISKALEQLGAQEEDVEIEVLAGARSGVLGLGSRQARVRVTRRPPAGASSGVTSPPPAPPAAPPRPAPERPARPAAPAREAIAPAPAREAKPPAPAGEQPPSAGGEERAPQPRGKSDLDAAEHEASEVLARILDLMGEKAEVIPSRHDGESVELEIKGDGSGILIGRHGQTLDALEYLVNRIVARRIRDAAPVMIETESYRARRRQQLHKMALSMGERAKREHEAVTLEPMPPRDRRVVHLALKDDPMVTTRSSGDGFMRSIEILPVEGRREREKRGRPREPKAALGEQGGFKHGQKKIV